jgi:hypothetical protein
MPGLLVVHPTRDTQVSIRSRGEGSNTLIESTAAVLQSTDPSSGAMRTGRVPRKTVARGSQKLF